MNMLELYKAYATYNMKGTTKPTNTSSNTSYRRDVLFQSATPIMRFCGMYREARHIAMFTFYGNPLGFMGCSIDRAPTPYQSELITVKALCLGVFSKYDGDVMPLPQLHKRQEWLYQQEYNAAYSEWKGGTAPDIAVDPGKYVNARIGRLKGIAKEWHNYCNTFELLDAKFLPDPEGFRDEFSDYFFSVADRYNSPSERIKRERANARKLARKAFLDAEKAA